MKRCMVFISAVVLLFGLSGVASAYSINSDFIAVGNEFTSPYQATSVNFNGGSPELWTWVGNGQVLSGDVINKASAPGGVDGLNKDLTPYITIPDSASQTVSGSVKVTNLGGTYNYFGIWWGSIDLYNSFTFYNGANVVLSVTGADVTAAGTADGNQILVASNHYVNFLDLPDFDSFEMSSTQFAFEADNIAIARNPSRVPEPTTLLLLGLGLIGMAGVRRFRK